MTLDQIERLVAVYSTYNRRDTATINASLTRLAVVCCEIAGCEFLNTGVARGSGGPFDFDEMHAANVALFEALREGDLDAADAAARRFVVTLQPVETN